MSRAELARLLAKHAEALVQAKAALGHRATLSKRFITRTEAAVIARAFDTKLTAGKASKARRRSHGSRSVPDPAKT